MRLIFCGTSAFSAVILDRLVRAGHQIGLVLTQPDRPAGRGMKMMATPVKDCALHHQVPVITPVSLKEKEVLDQVLAINADAAVVVAYGLLLPQAFLDMMPRGCLNIHASLLPRWRGAAPIHRAIMAGDQMTGISIMKMDAGLDTGPVLDQVPVIIEPIDTMGRLENKLLETAILAIEQTLGQLACRPEVQGVRQNEALATYAAKIDKAEAVIDWQRSAKELDCFIRGLNPSPGAKTLLDGQILKIHLAKPVSLDHQAEPGTIIDVTDESLVIACGDMALCLLELQKANSKKMDVVQFLRGNRLAIGQLLG